MKEKRGMKGRKGNIDAVTSKVKKRTGSAVD